MKKVFILIAFFALTGIAKAQIFEIGAKAGISSSNLDFKDVQSLNLSTENNNTYNFGIYTRLKAPVIGLFVQPELMFNNRSSNVTIENNGKESRFVTKVQSFEVPVMVGFKFVKLVRVYAGPNFQFVTKQETENIDSDPLMTVSESEKTNTGFQVGAGLDLLKFRVDLKYDMTNNMGSPFTYNGTSPNLKANLVTFQVGFRIFDLF